MFSLTGTQLNTKLFLSSVLAVSFGKDPVGAIRPRTNGTEAVQVPQDQTKTGFHRACLRPRVNGQLEQVLVSCQVGSPAR